MSYLWLDPETISPVGYGSGGINLQTMEIYDDPDRSVGSGNLLPNTGLTGFEIHNNFLNLGTICLNANNRIKTLELGQHSVVGDETYKGTVLYLGRKNGYGAFFAGGKAELPGTVDIKDAGTLMTSGDLDTDLQFKIGVNTINLFTVTIPNISGDINTRAELLTAINQSLLNNQLGGGPARYGFESSGLSYPVTINHGDTLNIVFDHDLTRYSYTYEYASPDGSTPLSLTSRSLLKTFLQTALNQAISDADSGVDVPAITKFISGADLGDSGANDVTLTFVSKAVDVDGSSKGSLTVAIKGEIPVIAKFATDEQVAEEAFDFSAVLNADFTSSGGDEFLYLNGENNESAKIVVSNSGISNANALFYLLGAISSDSTEILYHTKAPSISSDPDTAFGTQLLYGGVFTVPQLIIADSWAGLTSDKQGALYLSETRTPHDITDEQTTIALGGIFLPGNFAFPYVTSAPVAAPSPEYTRAVYCTADQKIYIYDVVDNAWYSTAALS